MGILVENLSVELNEKKLLGRFHWTARMDGSLGFWDPMAVESQLFLGHCTE